MEREKDPKDLRGEEPRPGDDAETALEKSGSMDERGGQAVTSGGTTDRMVVGAPAAHVPLTGTGFGGVAPGGASEGEQVLEQESKAQRARGDIQRG